MNTKEVKGAGLTSEAARIKLAHELKKLGIKNNQVIDLVSAMPRHLFIDSALMNRAYENVSLPIGHKQTISQPYIVAKMTELIHEMTSMNHVLEIGTGSGYQTSILSMLFKRVTTIERIKSLHENGLGYQRIAQHLNSKNITTLTGKEWKGNHVFAFLKRFKNLKKVLINQFELDTYPL